MKKLWNNFVVAFSMYSKIPMPRADWNKENMKYALCFFPWVGAVIGLLEFGWFQLALLLNFGLIFRSGIMVLIPLIVTGGIHADGLLDTADALSSWREKERRLEILKDSHAGAFAVIIGIGYFIAAFAAASEVSGETIKVLVFGFAFSRTCSAISVNHFPNANPKGTAATFGHNAEKRNVDIVMFLYLVLICISACLISPICGLVLILCGFGAFLFYYKLAMKYFGGITGDLAGFFVCVCELTMLLGLVICERIQVLLL